MRSPDKYSTQLTNEKGLFRKPKCGHFVRRKSSCLPCAASSTTGSSRSESASPSAIILVVGSNRATTPISRNRASSCSARSTIVRSRWISQSRSRTAGVLLSSPICRSCRRVRGDCFEGIPYTVQKYSHRCLAPTTGSSVSPAILHQAERRCREPRRCLLRRSSGAPGTVQAEVGSLLQIFQRCTGRLVHGTWILFRVRLSKRSLRWTTKRNAEGRTEPGLT